MFIIPTTQKRGFMPTVEDCFDWLLGGTPLDRQRTQIISNNDNVLIKMEVAGFSKENVTIDINDDVMTVSGKLQKKEGNENDSLFTAEEFTRDFNVKEIDTDNITAKCENGVLTIACPRKAAPPINGRKVNIE